MKKFAMKVVSEFVFNEGPPGTPVQRQELREMRSLKDFQIVLAIIDHYKQPASIVDRNALFMLLFGEDLSEKRTQILCRLLSTSISGSIALVLSSAGIWMHYLGSKSPGCIEVAKRIVSDFCMFSRFVCDEFKELPLFAEHFSSNLLMSITEIYFVENGDNLSPPPSKLVATIVHWLSLETKVCLNSKRTLLLPEVEDEEEEEDEVHYITPIEGLIRWVVLSPLVSKDIVYSTLHLALVKKIYDLENIWPTAVINVDKLETIVPSILWYCKRLKSNNKNPEQDELLEVSLQRFAQLIKGIIESKSFFGSISQLICAVRTLPEHPLMNVVLEKHTN